MKNFRDLAVVDSIECCGYCVHNVSLECKHESTCDAFVVDIAKISRKIKQLTRLHKRAAMDGLL